MTDVPEEDGVAGDAGVGEDGTEEPTARADEGFADGDLIRTGCFTDDGEPSPCWWDAWKFVGYDTVDGTRGRDKGRRPGGRRGCHSDGRRIGYG